MSAVRSTRPLLGTAVLLLLEIAARVARVPLYPGFALLLLGATPRARAAAGLALGIVEVALQGSSAWHAVAAATAASLVATRIRSARARAAAMALGTVLVWTAIASALDSPTSAGLEPLLAAVLVRVTAHEELASFAARIVLVLLFALSIGIVALLRAAGRRLLLAVAVAVGVAGAGCARPDGASLEPPPLASAGPLEPTPSATPRGGHPTLAKESRRDEVCRGCHEAKVGESDAGPEKKGFHEIHYRSPIFERACVDCHAEAGRAGFPGPYPRELARRRYNQGCASCHTADGAPHWDRRFR